jgi:hypothetical protein
MHEHLVESSVLRFLTCLLHVWLELSWEGTDGHCPQWGLWWPQGIPEPQRCHALTNAGPIMAHGERCGLGWCHVAVCRALTVTGSGHRPLSPPVPPKPCTKDSCVIFHCRLPTAVDLRPAHSLTGDRDPWGHCLLTSWVALGRSPSVTNPPNSQPWPALDTTRLQPPLQSGPGACHFVL